MSNNNRNTKNHHHHSGSVTYIRGMHQHSNQRPVRSGGVSNNFPTRQDNSKGGSGNPRFNNFNNYNNQGTYNLRGTNPQMLYRNQNQHMRPTPGSYIRNPQAQSALPFQPQFIFPNGRAPFLASYAATPPAATTYPQSFVQTMVPTQHQGQPPPPNVNVSQNVNPQTIIPGHPSNFNPSQHNIHTYYDQTGMVPQAAPQGPPQQPPPQQLHGIAPGPIQIATAASSRLPNQSPHATNPIQTAPASQQHHPPPPQNQTPQQEHQQQQQQQQQHVQPPQEMNNLQPMISPHPAAAGPYLYMPSQYTQHPPAPTQRIRKPLDIIDPSTNKAIDITKSEVPEDKKEETSKPHTTTAAIVSAPPPPPSSSETNKNNDNDESSSSRKPSISTSNVSEKSEVDEKSSSSSTSTPPAVLSSSSSECIHTDRTSNNNNNINNVENKEEEKSSSSSTSYAKIHTDSITTTTTKVDKKDINSTTTTASPSSVAAVAVATEPPKNNSSSSTNKIDNITNKSTSTISVTPNDTNIPAKSQNSTTNSEAASTIKSETTNTDTRDDGLEPISPTPLPPSPPPSQESSPSSTSSETKPKKKNKTMKAQLNRKCDEKANESDMDAFKGCNSGPTNIQETKTEIISNKLNQVDAKTSSVTLKNNKEIVVSSNEENDKSISSLSATSSEVSTPAEDIKKDSLNASLSITSATVPSAASDVVTVDASITSTAVSPAAPSTISTPSSKENTPINDSPSENPPPPPAQDNNEIHNGENGDVSSASSSKNSSMIKLKYEYKDGQWSPLNTEGKKQYDREFLMMLAKDPMSMTKPDNLPSMEIIKNKMNDHMKMKNPTPDFMPSYIGQIVKVNSRGGSVTKRPSRDGRGQRPPLRPEGGGTPRVISGLSIQEKVDLHTAENAWKPTKVLTKSEGGGPGGIVIGVDQATDVTDSTKKGEEESVEDLGKKVRSILNKLTPEKFTKLMVQFEALVIDTEEKLDKCINLVFEKAVDEPGFSESYALMCESLQKKSVTGKSDRPNFRRLLIKKCQVEFERDYMTGVDKAKYEKLLAEADNEQKKKDIKEEFEHKERSARRRSLGNIQFIGELYKLNMLTVRIMHECIGKLLRSEDEESLECLCRLLATVGKNLEQHTISTLNEKTSQPDSTKYAGIHPFDFYFDKIRGIVNKKNTSSRVRFALKDAIDLRQDGWKPRRERAGPKKINQIHEEVEMEKNKEQLLNYRQDVRSGSRGGSMQGGGGMDKRGGGGYNNRGSGSHNQQPQSDQGWTAVASKTYRQEKFDMNRIPSISKPQDLETMNLGPGARNSFNSWGKGSTSGSRSSQSKYTSNNSEEYLPQKNRFDTLSSSGNKDESSFSDRGSSSRGSRGGSADKDSRSSSLSYNQQRDDSSNSNSSKKESLPSQPSNNYSDDPSAQEKALKGQETNEEKIEKYTSMILNECFNNCNFKDAQLDLCEKMNSKNMVDFIVYVFNIVFDKNSKERNTTGEFLCNLVKTKLLLRSQLKSGLDIVLESATDYLCDIPKYWEYVGEVTVPLIEKDAISYDFLLQVANKSSNPEYGKKFITQVLLIHKKKILDNTIDDKLKSMKVDKMWSLAKEVFVKSETTPIQKFAVDYVSNELKTTSSADSSSLSDAAGSSSNTEHEKVQSKLRQLLSGNQSQNEKNNAIRDWVDNSLGPIKKKESWFIRILTDECLLSSLKKDNSNSLNPDLFNNCTTLLKIFLENDSDRELQALFAIQKRCHALAFPCKLLNDVFTLLFESEIITEDTFRTWKVDNSSQNVEGKGVAVTALTRFFTFLDEVEDDEKA